MLSDSLVPLAFFDLRVRKVCERLGTVQQPKPMEINMKPQCRRIVSFILCFSVLLSGSVGWGQSGDGKEAKQTLETYVTVVSKVHPAGGAVLGAMLKMLDFTGYFGKTADPVGEALKAINTRLDEHERQINQLKTDMAELRKEFRGEQNWDRFTRLRDSRGALRTIADRLEKRPTEVDTKIDIAGKAREVAEGFLDPEMWRWSDKSLKDQSWTNRFDRVESFKVGEMTDLDFKAMPTLEYYTTALVVWAAAMEYAAGGDPGAIKREYGDDLQKHITYLTQRPGWNDRTGDEPETLPEQVKARITGIYIPANYADGNGICYVNQIARDDMRRAFSSGAPLVYQTTLGRTEMCNVPPTRRNTAPDIERAKEREYGLDVMANLAAILTNLRDKGTVRGAATITQPTVTPVAEPFTGRHKAMFEEGGFKTSGGTAMEHNILYSVSPDGTLTWYRHMMKYANGNRNAAPTHSFNPPKTVGSGWAGGHKDVMPMGLMGIYSLRDDGTLRWNWHLGFADGSFNWVDSREIAKGLSGFTQIVAQDQGILYARIQGDPGIFWGATSNYDNKKGAPSASIPLRLTSQTINFAAFKTIFAGGKGVLYGIGHDNRLYWMKHNFYQSPMPDPGIRMPGHQAYEQWMRQWSGPVEIARDLSTVKHAFSPGEGHLYFVYGDGTLVWRRHQGWETGTGTSGGLPGAVVIAQGWGSYKFAFARNTTSDAGSGNRAVDIIVN
jgi:hypothetical protein